MGIKYYWYKNRQITNLVTLFRQILQFLREVFGKIIYYQTNSTWHHIFLEYFSLRENSAVAMHRLFQGFLTKYLINSAVKSLTSIWEYVQINLGIIFLKEKL